MSRINLRRVLGGGLLAGIVILVSGFCLGHFVLGAEYVAKFKTFFPQSPTRMLATHLTMRLGFGILSVFLFAAMRPRFRSPGQTIWVAGLVLWLLSYVPLTLALHDLSLLETRQFVVVLVWGLTEAVLATAIGSSFYRDVRR